MSLKLNPYSDFVVVTGLKARGKTTYTIYLVKELLNVPFIAIDPAHQLSALGYCVHYPQNIARAMRQFKHVVFQPIKSSFTETETYDLAFKECYRFRNYLLIIDEVDEFAPTWGFKSEHLNELVKRGRTRGIGLICNSRRPHNFNKAIRNNADFVVCFQIVEEDDLKYMSKWINTSKAKIKALKPYYSYLYDVKEGKTTLQHPCPKTW